MDRVPELCAPNLACEERNCEMLTQMLLSATVWAPQGLITSPHKGLQRKGGAGTSIKTKNARIPKLRT